MENKYFYFNECCILVKGSKKSAVYDLLNEDIFALDENLSRVLEEPYLSVEEYIEKGKLHGLSETQVQDALNELNLLGVSRFSPQKMYIDKADYVYNTDKINLNEISIRVTNKCMLDCFFCGNKESDVCFPCNRSLKDSNRNIPVGKLEEVLLHALLFACKNVTFTGGDPFLAGDEFIRLVKFAALNFECVQIVSNLSSLSEVQKNFLKQHGNIHLFFPFFGVEHSAFAEIIGKSDELSSIIRNVSELKNAGVKMTALILKAKGKDITKTEEYLKSVGIEWHVISPLPLSGNEKVLEISDNYSIKDLSFKKIALYDFMFRHTYNRCLGRKIAIDLSGDVKPCLKSQDILGNIFEDSFKDILLTCKHEKYWFLSKDKVKVCKDCEFRYGCSHDCPVAAKNLKDGIDSEFPFCSYDPYTGKWENRIEKETR